MLLWLLGCPTPLEDTSVEPRCTAQDGQVLLDGEEVASLAEAVEQATPWSSLCLGAGEYRVTNEMEFARHDVVPGKIELHGVGPETRLISTEATPTAIGSPDHLELADLTLAGVSAFGGSMRVLDLRVESTNVLYSNRGTARNVDLDDVRLWGRWTLEEGVSVSRMELDDAVVQGLYVEAADDVAVTVRSPSVLIESRLVGNPVGAVGIQPGASLEIVDVSFEDNGCDLGTLDDDAGLECTQETLGHVEALLCDDQGTCR